MRHWLYDNSEEFTKLEAWIDILFEVNHAPKKILIGNQLVECKRGESLNSLDTWAKRWNWNKSKVRRFLKLLESDSMIAQKVSRKTTHISACNYEKYQDLRNDNETKVKRKRNDDETIATPNNKDNKDNNGNNIYPLPEKDGKGGTGKKIKPIWYDDYQEYRLFVKSAFEEFVCNGGKEWAESTYPSIDYTKTMTEMYNNYWATEDGWKNKRDSWRKSVAGNIDWSATIRRNYKKSAVYKER